MKRLLRKFDNGYEGRKARAYTSALVGHESKARCALASTAQDGDRDYHLVHVFDLPASQVSHGGVDFNQAVELRLYSWSGLMDVLNNLDSDDDSLIEIERASRSHRAEFQSL